MKPKLTVMPMGRGHALSICMSFRLDPGELAKLRDDASFRQQFTEEVIATTVRDYGTHLPAALENLHR